MLELDPRQTAVLNAGPEDVFVAAGAGSGKTRVLTARFVAAVLGEPPYTACDPGGIVAVTFTEKAAGELFERIRRSLNAAGEAPAARGMGEAWISTIHGMCSRILRRHAFEAGIDPYFRVLDQVESSVLQTEALEAAAAECSESVPGMADMLDTYGAGAVLDAARRVRDSVYAMGLQIEDVVTVSPADAGEDLRRIARELSSIAYDFAALGERKSIEGNASCARAAAELVAASLPGGFEHAERLLATLTTKGFVASKAVEGMPEMVEGARALIEEALACARQILVSPMQGVLLEFTAAYARRYEAAKGATSALDFEDLQRETAALLERRPDIAAQYRARFEMLMLDEFQDTNSLQLGIVQSLSDGNLCTVGDENQSIYSFRYADVEVFRQRGRDVATSRVLDINYRTEAGLLGAVNNVFSHPAMLGSGFMRLSAPPGAASAAEDASEPAFEVRFVDRSSAKGMDGKQAEATVVAQRVGELVAAGVAPGDIAVLMRVMSGGAATAIEQELMARDIPVYIASGGAFFECAEVVEARALLKVIDNVRDDAALVVVLAGRITGLSTDALLAVREQADNLGRERGAARWEVHLWEALQTEIPGVHPAEMAVLQRLREVVTRARRLRGVRSLGDTVLQPLMELDYDVVCFASGKGGARAWSNMLKLAQMASEYEEVASGGLSGFQEYLEQRDEHSVGEREATLDGEFDAVRVMSIHAAKGLEFPVVVVAGLASGGGKSGRIVSGRVDHRPMLGMSFMSAGHAEATTGVNLVKAANAAVSGEESIRLFYVACTRAMRGLTVVASTDPEKEADDKLVGSLRRSLGLGSVELPQCADLVLGEGATRAYVRVRVVEPLTPDSREHEAASVAPAGPAAVSAPPVHPAPLRTVEPPVARAGVPERLAYTGLATYEQCPYRFYLTAIARLAEPPASRSGEAVSFGSAVHAVLERVTTRDIPLEPLLDSVAASRDLDAAARRRLQDAIRSYLALPVASAVFGSERVMREAPIAVPVAGTLLAGAIDAIAWNGSQALIVDYKTGASSLEVEEARDRYRLQGECYALAAFASGASDVEVVFAEVERGRQTAFRYSAPDREVLVAHVEEIVGRMKNEGFPSRESYSESCETCPGLGGMCGVRRR